MSQPLTSPFDIAMDSGAQSLFIAHANWRVDYEGKEGCVTDLRAIVGPVQTFELQTDEGIEKREGREVLLLRNDLVPCDHDNADHTYEGLSEVGMQAYIKIGKERWAVTSIAAKTTAIVRVELERRIPLEVTRPRYRTAV